jgi:cathepsin B
MVLVGACTAAAPVPHVLNKDFALLQFGFIQSNTSWVAGVNARFSGPDYAAVLRAARRQMGAAPVAHALPVRGAGEGAVLDVPATWNSVTAFPHCPSLADIWDQGACASCFVLATVQSAADRMCVATQGNRTMRLSAQHMLSCCKSCGNGCAGGFPPYAWAWMSAHGVVR